jgi:adenosyl cobinamide kinase/adenosyl cobinamide phosphate guanylyltransferase
MVDSDSASGRSNAKPRIGRLCVLTGGVRAGKSSAAQDIALAWGQGEVTVIATAQALDDEMSDRIRKHRSDRPPSWETIEEPLDVASALRRAKHRTILLDCANLWVTNLLLSPDAKGFDEAVQELLDARRETGADLIVVTNEVGWGIVPDNALSRQFRDQLGWVNQKLVAESTEAWLYVSGAAIPLKAP